MPVPEGNWPISAEGLGSGTLTITSDGPGHLTGTAFGKPLVGFFAQEASAGTVVAGTIEFVLDPASNSELYFFSGDYFQLSESTTVKNATTVVTTMVGTVQSVKPPASGLALGAWLVQASAKVKEKDKEEKEKEQTKDTKDTKDHKDAKEHSKDKDKDGVKDKEGHLEQVSTVAPQSEATVMQQLIQRVDALEQRFAPGQAFIGADERPAVGEHLLMQSSADGQDVVAGAEPVGE